MRDAELLPGWHETSLGKLGTFFRGRGGTRADEEPNGLPCIRYGDLYTHHDCIVRSFASSISPASVSSYTRLQQGDVVFAASGETFEEIGKAAVYCEEAPAYAGADTIIFRPGPNLLPRFAGYAVNSESVNAHKSRMGQGSSVIHIGSNHLSKIHFKLPPQEQQQRIAEILSTVDDAIEQTEALIAKTQQIKAGLMHDLFTRGVTPDGQLRPPRNEAPHLYKQSPLGWIPKEWEYERLDNLLAPVACPIRSGPFGSALLKEELVENGIPLLGIDNVFAERFVAEYRRFVTPHKFVELSRYTVFPGDVIITIMGTVGKCCIVPDDADRALSSKHLWTMTFDSNKVVPELVCWQLNYASWVQTWFARQSQGAVMDAIQSSILRTLTLPVPSTTEQLMVRDRYLVMQGTLAAETERLQKLKEIKSGLMQDLLSGHVQVVVTNPTVAKETTANA